MSIPLLLGLFVLAVLAYLVWREFSPGKPALPWGRREPEVKQMLQERLFLPRQVATGRKKAPISGRCYACSKPTTLPYKCKFCAGLYCDKHRLPESHDCQGLKRLKRDQDK
jgi:hypothetical protein